MTQLRHFTTADQISSYFLGRQLNSHLIIVNECKILKLADYPELNDGRKLKTLIDSWSKFNED